MQEARDNADLREREDSCRLNAAQPRGHKESERGAADFPGEEGEGGSEATRMAPVTRQWEPSAHSPLLLIADNCDTSCLQSPAENTADQYVTPHSHTPCSSNISVWGNVLSLNLRSSGPSISLTHNGT